MVRRYYIYQIENIANGKKYIGMSVNPKARLLSHFSALRRGKHEELEFQEDFNKYGAEGFKQSILCTCVDKDSAHKQEVIAIKDKLTFIPEYGYNCRDPYFWTWQGISSDIVFFDRLTSQQKTLLDLGYEIIERYSYHFFVSKVMERKV